MVFLWCESQGRESAKGTLYQDPQRNAFWRFLLHTTNQISIPLGVLVFYWKNDHPFLPTRCQLSTCHLWEETRNLNISHKVNHISFGVDTDISYAALLTMGFWAGRCHCWTVAKFLQLSSCFVQCFILKNLFLFL